MEVAVQNDLGVYAAANDAFLTALSNGSAQYGVNLLSTYASMTAGQASSIVSYLTSGNQPLTSLTAPLAISDASSAIASNLDALQALASANELSAITLTDSSKPTFSLTAAQLSSDASALSKITSAYVLTVTTAFSSAAQESAIPATVIGHIGTHVNDPAGLIH